jgi:hypothetical protein
MILIFKESISTYLKTIRANIYDFNIPSLIPSAQISNFINFTAKSYNRGSTANLNFSSSGGVNLFAFGMIIILMF